ncbi:DUF4286 family protein [Chloroflexota bacterium]
MDSVYSGVKPVNRLWHILPPEGKGDKAKMEEKWIIHMVGTECSPDMEDKFNKWYDEVHVPMLLKFPGISAAVRYQITEASAGYPKYLTAYKFESKEAFESYGKSQELADTIAETLERWGEKGINVQWRVQYKPMKIWKK